MACPGTHTNLPQHNHPLDEVLETVSEIRRQKKGTFFQKFTCSFCGARQTMEKANTIFDTGKCEECGHITDIRVTGCNYMLIVPIQSEKGSIHD